MDIDHEIELEYPDILSICSERGCALSEEVFGRLLIQAHTLGRLSPSFFIKDCVVKVASHVEVVRTLLLSLGGVLT